MANGTLAASQIEMESQSGTGITTIVPPATNTDRTLTLPDAAGVMYAQGNILGTVSQSGGVPTGAIIERGSNANGEFVKYADGTLICTGIFNKNNGTTSAQSFSFAASFISTSNMGMSAGQTDGSTATQPRITSVSTSGFLLAVQVVADGVLSTVVREARVIAIGRWF